jgi:hypothetical protein
MDDKGLSSGKTIMKWHEVTKVTAVGFGIHIAAKDRKIVLAPYAYKNPDELREFVKSSLAKPQ